GLTVGGGIAVAPCNHCAHCWRWVSQYSGSGSAAGSCISQAGIACKVIPLVPVRRVVPSISNKRAENTISPVACCAWAKNEVSTTPVPSATEIKTTRSAERIGGVCVASRTPAARTRVWFWRLRYLSGELAQTAELY